MRAFRINLVLDSFDSVEDDGPVATVDVVEAVQSGVYGGSAKDGELHDPSGRARPWDFDVLQVHREMGIFLFFFSPFSLEP